MSDDRFGRGRVDPSAIPPVATVVRTGMANSASVAAALDRAGCVVHLTSDRAAIESADLLVLPGVGAFGAGMAALRAASLDGVISDRVTSGRPTLAICLGLQLLCVDSQETPGVRGLGVIEASVRRYPKGVITPQFGWNRVRPDESFGLAGAGHAYFANSYRITDAPAGWSFLWADHGGPFVAGLRRGPVLACQFHPELSGGWGMALLRSWIECVAASRESSPASAAVGDAGPPKTAATGEQGRRAMTC